MSFDESTARDLNPSFEESTADAQRSPHVVGGSHGPRSQNSNHETTTLTTETPELTALETENPQPTVAEHEAAAHASDVSEMDFAAALESFEAEQSAAEAAPAEDNIQKGTVVKLTDKYVVVDIGSKSEGMVPIAEVMDHDGKPKVQAGDEIHVVRDKGQTEEGYIKLSFQKVHRLVLVGMQVQTAVAARRHQALNE